MTASTAGTASRAPVRPSLLAGAAVGVGVMAAVDEIVFHQLLRWHSFYDGAGREAGIVSDGLLHAASLALLVGGFFLLLDLRRRDGLSVPLARAGVLVGAGGFQVFDGLVDHKVLRVHQVRYGVDLLPYDIAWVASGLVLLAAGAALAVAAARRAGPSRHGR